MSIFLLVAATLAQSQQANLERPVVCVSAATTINGVVAAGASDLEDSVRDLDRALRMLGRRRFEVRRQTTTCTVRLVVVSRSDNQEGETRTLAVRLTAQPLKGPLHVEELHAVEGSWRDAATSIARNVRFFVDQNQETLAHDVEHVPADRERASVADIGSDQRAGVEHSTAAATVAVNSRPPQVIEDGILDRIHLVAVPPVTIDTPVYVRLFDASRANLGTGGAGGKSTRASEAQMIQNQAPALLRERLLGSASDRGLQLKPLDAAKADSLPAGALILEGAFATIDPGSRAKRYWVGFGAGKTILEIAGRILNREGETVAEFRHRRVGAIGLYGGDSAGKLLSDVRSSGEDVARFMGALLAGASLK